MKAPERFEWEAAIRATTAKPSVKVVWQFLLDASDDKGESHYGFEAIGKQCGQMSQRQIRRIIGWLQRAKVITHTRWHGRDPRYRTKVLRVENPLGVTIESALITGRKWTFQESRGDKTGRSGGTIESAKSTSESTSKSAAPETKSNHAPLRKYFVEKWGAKYTGKYPFKNAVDGKAVKAILAACENFQDAKRRVDAYLASPNEYYAKRHHPLTVLMADVIDFAEERPAPPTARAEHWIIAEARSKWPDHVKANIPFWTKLVLASDGGEMRFNAMRRALTKSETVDGLVAHLKNKEAYRATG